MNDLTELKKVKEIVRRELIKSEKARDSDDYLYACVVFACKPWALNISVEQFLTRRAEFGIPGFETVRRTRQKVQAEHPELKGERVEERKEAEKDFYKFAKEDK